MMTERAAIHDLHLQESALQSALDYANAAETPLEPSFSKSSATMARVEIVRELTEVQNDVRLHQIRLKEEGKRRDGVLGAATGWKTKGTVGEEVAVSM